MKNDFCRSRRLAAVPFASLVILVVAGCFTGEYNRRMTATLQQLQVQSEKAGAVFPSPSAMLDASGAQTGIRLRLPIFVDATAKPMQAGDPNAQPPFCQLPGFAYSYEMPLATPAYFYVAAVSGASKSRDELMQEVEASIAKTFSGAAWQDVSVERFEGGTITLSRIRAVGPQKFGTGSADGQFDLYLASSQNHHVLIGWRASSDTQGFFDKVAISMGTIQGGQ
jgi:hypothetical protein